MKIKILIVLLLIFGAHFVYADGENINLFIRDGSNVIFSGSVILPSAGVSSVADLDGNMHDINSDSVLNVLHQADLADDSWNVSNLTYYNSFNSFYLKCLNSGSGEKCDNWQYAINDSSPSSSIDQNILSGGENVFFYFGNQHRVRLVDGRVETNKSFVVSAEKYNYTNNTWAILSGVTVGATQINPNDAFNPIEVATGMVDVNGQVNLKLAVPGSYNIGIKEDFYFPTEALSVVDPLPLSGGEVIPVKKEFNSNQALDFLSSQQKEDGTFGADIFTDWSTLALCSSSLFSSEKEKVKNYFLQEKLDNFSLTDYERRTMALEALGVNPYDVNGVNYIEKITNTFDGYQFGDKDIVNDDIFALIVLQNAGYLYADDLINKDINFIVSRQQEDGSWEGSVDLTGASMEALIIYKQDLNVQKSLDKAKEFLKKNQKSNGSFGNMSSTAWALEGVLALGENFQDWAQGNSNLFQYLADNQDKDGGIIESDNNSKIWQTAYVILSLSGQTWNQIMKKFDKVKIEAVAPILKEESKVETIKESIPNFKPIVKKIAKKVSAKNIEVNSVASVIQANIETPKIEQHQSWLRRFFSKIFGF